MMHSARVVSLLALSIELDTGVLAVKSLSGT